MLTFNLPILDSISYFFDENLLSENMSQTTEKTNSPEPIVDDCDRYLLEQYHWRLGKTCGWFRRWRESGKQKTEYLHRKIFQLTGNQGFQVVFRDGDKSNCSRNNLEVLTMSEFSKRNMSQ